MIVIPQCLRILVIDQDVIVLDAVQAQNEKTVPTPNCLQSKHFALPIVLSVLGFQFNKTLMHMLNSWVLSTDLSSSLNQYLYVVLSILAYLVQIDISHRSLDCGPLWKPLNRVIVIKQSTFVNRSYRITSAISFPKCRREPVVLQVQLWANAGF